ncbi:MAG: hypothetical protein DSY77_00270 [Bacteroidetes bacterium]|nr:MAG: hypothetical protein DSY77_00270 [Bacteroidota bacterium]
MQGYLKKIGNSTTKFDNSCFPFMLRKLLLLLFSILTIAVLLVPSRSDYFQRLKYDFGEVHQSSSLNAQLLMEMGNYTYQNRLIFSQFEYKFGNISVSYYGFFNIIIFKKSKIKRAISPNITV